MAVQSSGERGPGPGGSSPALAVALRELRQRRGMTLRQLAARSGYSASALSTAETGRRPASWALTEAFVQACGEDPRRWRDLWAPAPIDHEATPAPALPPEPLADGADPDRSGCGYDKVTVHARKLVWTDHLPEGFSNVHLGAVQLRYSPARGAVWGRFVGTAALDHVAGGGRVDVEIGVHRVDDDARTVFRCGYCFDVHWSDILLVKGSAVYARAVLILDGRRIAESETDWLRLSPVR
ncbi:helix-turn-helix domain-containing protein [Micromonospora sp. NPDC049559]|uniref:helix-turn-helix domain-containing protein n=1 Tax=Micromonospora sp. NPDC049559 TaxID=3155923 RepID=UPI003445DB75